MRTIIFFIFSAVFILTGCSDDTSYTEHKEIEIHQQKCIECLRIQNQLLKAELTLEETHSFHLTDRSVRKAADRGMKEAIDGSKMCRAVADHPGVEALKVKFHDVYMKLKSREDLYSK